MMTLHPGWTGAIGPIRLSRATVAKLHVRKLIFSGDLLPGAHVSPDEIAESLGISRIPVREALIALEREGWVTIRTHRGAFVQMLDVHAVRDQYEIYGLTYDLAVRKALERCPHDLSRRLTLREREFNAASHPEKSLKALSFHREVTKAAGSPRIEVTLRSMSRLVPENFFLAVPEAVEMERMGMHSVVRAVRDADEDAAATAYRNMMAEIGERVVVLFSERGLLGSPTHT